MIKGFSIGASHTFNLGQFNSARVEATIQIDVGDKEQYDDCVIGAERELHKLLEKTYEQQVKKRKENGT